MFFIVDWKNNKLIALSCQECLQFVANCKQNSTHTTLLCTNLLKVFSSTHSTQQQFPLRSHITPHHCYQYQKQAKTFINTAFVTRCIDVKLCSYDLAAASYIGGCQINRWKCPVQFVATHAVHRDRIDRWERSAWHSFRLIGIAYPWDKTSKMLWINKQHMTEKHYWHCNCIVFYIAEVSHCVCVDYSVAKQ